MIIKMQKMTLKSQLNISKVIKKENLCRLIELNYTK